MNFTIIDIVNGGASQEKEKSLRDSHRKRKLINENRVEEVQTTLHHRTRYSLTEKKIPICRGNPRQSSQLVYDLIEGGEIMHEHVK